MFEKSHNHNPNYLASIVDVKEFHVHPNADRVKIARIFGNNIITSIDAEPGLYCYFPLECSLSFDFLRFTNSFSDAGRNTNNSKKGFFDKNGRVKPVVFRGEKSEGYMVPVSTIILFSKVILRKKIIIDNSHIGTDFDLIFNHPFCKKYIPRSASVLPVQGIKKTKGSLKRYESKLIPDQFRFHSDTAHLKRNIYTLQPSDIICISEKYHGTSFVVSNVLVKKKINWTMKLAKMIGVPIVEAEYGMIYSSRSVIKNHSIMDSRNSDPFYKEDIYKIVADSLYPHLEKGMTAYGEIVGYTPSGSSIQKGYSYGCSVGKLDFMVYRMTYTNMDGIAFELSHPQVVAYCKAHDIKVPHIHYYGKAQDLYQACLSATDEKWNDIFLELLSAEHLENDCRFCDPGTPAEGIVLRIDNPNQWHVFKLKSFRFLSNESAQMDSGEIDMETSESVKDTIDN